MSRMVPGSGPDAQTATMERQQRTGGKIQRKFKHQHSPKGNTDCGDTEEQNSHDSCFWKKKGGRNDE